MYTLSILELLSYHDQLVFFSSSFYSIGQRRKMGLSFFLFYLPEIKFKKKTTSVFSAVPRGHFVIGIKVDLIIKFVILKMDFSDLDGHIHNVVNTRRPERSSSLCANPKTSEFFIFYYYYYYYSFSSDEKTQTFIVIGT